MSIFTANDRAGRRESANLRISESRPGVVRTAWNYAKQFASLLLFVVGGFFLALSVPALRKIWGAERAPERTQRLIQALFRFYIRWNTRLGLLDFDASELDDLRDARGLIIASNHPGLLDAVFMIPHVPNAVCIMRGSLMRHPSLGATARLAGYITNDRGSELIRGCVRKLNEGRNLLIFPEGTRTRFGADGVNSFQSGFALAAVKSGAAVQTVFIEMSGRFLRKECGLLAAAKVPLVMRMRLGGRFNPGPGESAKEFSKRLEDYFRSKVRNSEIGVGLR